MAQEADKAKDVSSLEEDDAFEEFAKHGKQELLLVCI